jgi:hypothetical protein
MVLERLSKLGARRAIACGTPTSADDFADRRRKADAARGERRLGSECSILMRWGLVARAMKAAKCASLAGTPQRGALSLLLSTSPCSDTLWARHGAPLGAVRHAARTRRE